MSCFLRIETEMIHRQENLSYARRSSTLLCGVIEEYLEYFNSCLFIYVFFYFFLGVMSRRGRRKDRELASESEARRHQRDQPDSPLLENDNHECATTSYASMNPTDVIDHHVTF